MEELGELEKHHADFASRHVKVVVASNDEPEVARETQVDFPHLQVVADTKAQLARAIEVMHPGAGPNGDTFAPTTFLVNGSGEVKWYFRPTHVVERLSPAEVLKAIDETWPK